MSVSVCRNVHMSDSDSEGRKKALDHWSWSYRQLVTSCPNWMLGPELLAPRAVHTLHC